MSMPRHSSFKTGHMHGLSTTAFNVRVSDWRGRLRNISSNSETWFELMPCDRYNIGAAPRMSAISCASGLADWVLDRRPRRRCTMPCNSLKWSLSKRPDIFWEVGREGDGGGGFLTLAYNSRLLGVQCIIKVARRAVCVCGWVGGCTHSTK